MDRTFRIALGLVLVWWSLRAGAGRWIFLDFVNLAFHEAGHVLLAFAGSTLHVLGGTLGQLVVPGLLAAHFLVRQGQPLGAAVCAWWLGQSLCNVSVYMADARDLALPLVGGGDHDWNELFFRWGVLDAASVGSISGAARGVGIVVMLVGLAWTAWLVVPARERGRVLEVALRD